MDRQPKIVAEPATIPLNGRLDEVAQRLSRIFHPVYLSIVNVLLVGLFGLDSWLQGLLWACLVIALQLVPGIVFFTVRMRQGAYSDSDVSQRHQRHELYIFGLVNMVLCLFVLDMLAAPLPLRVLIVGALVIGLVGFVVNLFWKISVHATSVGTTATLATIYVLPLGILLWVCALLVGWARVRTRNHTPLQVAAGLTLAAVCITGAFAAGGLL